MSNGFPTTRWSAIAGARSDDEAERKRSWTTLVAAYWKPAYKHVRIRWQKPREDAEDLVQAFFERAMEKDFFASYEPERARFRTFFRVCVDRFVSNEEKARTRQKRGGKDALLGVDFDAAESELEHVDRALTPEDLFDREWRRSLFAIAIAALREQCEGTGKQECFAAFERYDLAESRPTYDAVGSALGIPATTVTNHLAFCRRELRRIVLDKLGEITETNRERDAEARILLGPA